jgi:hypothetical protein
MVKLEIRSRAKNWCIERSLTKEGASFLATSFWLKEQRQGMLNPTPNEGLIAEVYAKVG